MDRSVREAPHPLRSTFILMRAYKFLDAEGRAPFTGTPWTPARVGRDDDRCDACREGVHACRSADVAYWFDDAMWEVELDGEIIETRHKVVATRGPPVRRITDYPEAARELAELGTWRCRDRAVDALRTAGDGELAARFAAAATLEELAACGGDVVDSNWAGAAAALAADAAHFAITAIARAVAVRGRLLSRPRHRRTRRWAGPVRQRVHR